MKLISCSDLTSGKVQLLVNNVVQSAEPMEVSQVRTRTCDTCGRRGHISIECPKRTRQYQRETRCLICNISNRDTNN